MGRSSDGIRNDLLVTFIRASRKGASKKYKPFLDTVLPLIKQHTIQIIPTETFGSATVENLPLGRYYVFGGWQDYTGTYVWDIPVMINDEENPVSLSTDNWTYKER